MIALILINRAADVNISRDNFARQTKSDNLHEFSAFHSISGNPKIHLIGDRPSEAIQEKRHH